MTDSIGTLKDIARAIEQLAMIRVRQQFSSREAIGLERVPDLELEVQDVRNLILSLAETLPAGSVEAEEDALLYAAL